MAEYRELHRNSMEELAVIGEKTWVPSNAQVLDPGV